MSTFFKHIASDRIFLFGCIGTILCIIFSLMIILILYAKLPPFVPLFNQMPWGVARLGTKDQMFIPLFITTMTLMVNISIGSYVYEKMPLVSRILCITGLLIAVFTLLFTIKTVQIII